jgi:metal-responsive CopG/Arc/MetJ family transcriptional regulator
MAKGQVKKVIQVPIEDELLDRIDTTAGIVAESRAAFIREACKQRLKNFETEELDRRYMAGYRKKPEGTDWAQASVRLLSKRLPKEKW